MDKFSRRNQSFFVEHQPCPNCGSRDNLAVYTDGHTYCFGCGYITNGNRRLLAAGGYLETASREPTRDRRRNETTSCYLPSDTEPVYSYSSEGSAKYRLAKFLTEQEIVQYKFCQSEQGVTLKNGTKVAPLLITPVFVKGELVFWQGRNLNDGQKPKYVSRGRPPEVILNEHSSTIVLVEDYISAIVVSRVCAATPIFGSVVSLERIITLCNQFKSVWIWLDMDKTKESRRVALKAQQLGLPVHTLHTEKDPKFYTEGEIKSFLGESNE